MGILTVPNCSPVSENEISPDLEGPDIWDPFEVPIIVLKSDGNPAYLETFTGFRK
jgi:hypothetical protein